jgi:ankyrin repeat protein/mannosyltransferase OCH1-like enzyme
MLDSKYKLSHLAEYVRDVSKIPQITHQIYFSSPTAPLALDKLSIEITLKTLTRLNQGSALFKHYFWTNNFDIVPQRIKDIANLEIRLINELENHLLYPLLLQMLEASSTNSQILLAASDLARLIALKEFGGSYRDLDYEIYRSERLLELIKAFTFLGGKEFPHDPVFFGSAFIAATKDHHIINKALELFKRNFDKKNVPEYVQYPCHKVFKQVYETGPAVITMAIHKAANQGENVDLILPGYHLFNMDYANANNQDSLCYTARKLSLEMYPDTIGADLFCGSWHKKKGAEDRIYYPKNLFKAVRNGDKQAVKFLLEQGVSIENGPDIPSIEENVMEILLPLGNGRVSFIGCYDSNQESIFTQEGISYQQENQKLIQDATYKIKHSNKFVGKQKIPNITHQVYFSSKTSPKPMDNISQKKVSINVQRLKNFTEDWRHIIWTNDFNLIPENIKNIPKVEVRLVGELEGSSLYPSVVVMLEMSSRDHKMLVAASDVARLIALQKFGGIYYDLDYEIFRPERLFDLMKSFNFFAGKEGVENDEKLTLIGNAILASSPNHLVINRAIEIANNNIKGLGKEYSKYPCSKSSELVFKAGGPIITMAYLLVANKDGNCDVVMPNTIFYNFDYIRSQTPESLCHVPGKEAVLGEDAIGADMFCGSWHQNKEFYNLNYYPKNNDLYLFKAAMFGYTRIVEYFIKEKGADVNTLSTIGATPLHISIQENHFSTVQYLLANKADLEIKASNNLTGLAIAVQKKHKRIARLLLEAGANTETIFPSEVTPLYVAIYLKDQDMAVLLIEHGANKDTVVLEARHKNDLEVLKGISEMEEFYNNKLFTAAQIGDLEMAMQAIAAGANINYIHTLGATSLYIASQNGHLSLVNLLIKNGAKLDLAIADGRTSLFIAAFNGHSEVVAAFIEAGADMEISSQGHTPLYAAIYNGFKDVVILLLKSGASIENNLNRFTPMFIAASKGLNKKALQNDRDIYQIVLEYYWEIVKKMHVHHAQFHNEKSFEVVIARYNEPTDWIAKEFPSEKVTIYNKGDEITDIHSNWHIVNIPNVGLEPYSYFTHIVTNYASLADRVLFMQGTPYDHPVYLPLSLYKKNVISGCKNIIAKCENTTVKFEVDAANNALLNNRWASYDGGKYANVVVRNGLLEFMQKFICPYPIETAFQINWGAEFAVDKENILRHPVEYYESFLSSLDIQFPGEVHWLERLWDLVFQECHY